MDKGEIILYQSNNAVAVEVRLEKESVWLTQDQMAILFDRSKKTISEHIRNVFSECELDERVVVRNFRITTQHGAIAGKTQENAVNFYNLDVIISVGYRVKSLRGTQFRIWANQVLRNYILKGYAVNNRFEQLENRVTETEKKIDFFVKTSLPPIQGIFFEGQIFDAYIFASKLIKSAKKTIVLIDNYIDESVLLLLSKRNVNVKALVYTKRISEQLHLDLAKHNSQYEPINVEKSDIFHDRFLIIDDIVYHVGASLKDLGKKLFAFSKMEIKSAEFLKNIHL